MRSWDYRCLMLVNVIDDDQFIALDCHGHGRGRRLAERNQLVDLIRMIVPGQMQHMIVFIQHVQRSVLHPDQLRHIVHTHVSNATDVQTVDPARQWRHTFNDTLLTAGHCLSFVARRLLHSRFS